MDLALNNLKCWYAIKSNQPTNQPTKRNFSDIYVLYCLDCESIMQKIKTEEITKNKKNTLDEINCRDDISENDFNSFVI